MHASALSSEHRDGVIQIVPVADKIDAVCLEGDFDLRNAPFLDDEIYRALERGNGLILDLSEATFIDSSVIHTLMRASKAAALREQAIVLQLGTAASVERVLEIARIEQVLPRAHDRHEAVRIIYQQEETM